MLVGLPHSELPSLLSFQAIHFNNITAFLELDQIVSNSNVTEPILYGHTKNIDPTKPEVRIRMGGPCFSEHLHL